MAAAIIADIALGAVLYRVGNSGYFWAFMIANRYTFANIKRTFII